MCSKFSHVQRDCTCACAVACLCPHCSISNVVASVTIHDNMKIFLRDVAKKMKPLWKVKGFFNRTSWKVSDVQIVRKTWVLSSSSVSVSVCCVLCVAVVLVVVVVEGGEEEVAGRRRRESNRTIWAKVSLKIAQTEQPYNHTAADSLHSAPQENWS